jgi:integrase
MAVNDNILSRNPVELLHTPKGVRRERRVLTLDQAKPLFSLFGLRDRLILKLAAIAGLRPGEIFGLRWDNTTEGSRLADASTGASRTPRRRTTASDSPHSAPPLDAELAVWREWNNNTQPDDWGPVRKTDDTAERVELLATSHRTDAQAPRPRVG